MKQVLIWDSIVSQKMKLNLAEMDFKAELKSIIARLIWLSSSYRNKRLKKKSNLKHLWSVTIHKDRSCTRKNKYSNEAGSKRKPGKSKFKNPLERCMIFHLKTIGGIRPESIIIIIISYAFQKKIYHII